MKKIGIMGGTFNPPHIGHLIMANEVFHTLELDEIRFMPNAIPPHKEHSITATSTQRLKMTEFAIKQNEHFKIEPIEINEGGVSYSFDTISKLVESEPDVQFYFIIGGDMIDSLHTWYRIEELVKIVQFVGVGRPGTLGKTTLPMMYVDAPLIDLSSTFLRNRLSNGQTVTYLLPESVETYIRKEGLYGTK
ncbi:MAG: nicotinate-nucleotide adenylyltransferase [Kurthia sp.]|uniref:Probable nicotinate-nucleotide adenylyltransferase n=1 Tax=Kurthia zopfii TaxID=1650 RepID=A0A8B4QBK1_9BACL|nr:nicotinate-nucleotide adenylyltransferase [Kurthia zopfii]PWI24053.1 nicotinate-nucleotide adenylyltransferase [Kurthia zopfii]TDR44308.1 nicotinate-nucleotide adenylyltransferase [Kurthia zopfii]GEK29736.1 putative nicotinate-nucleotide adenylyltransferase [Kurthia zopfii]STX10086.1 Probable nicotinate-nucleotide adenylyltransferase [Kurthia zopfii]